MERIDHDERRAAHVPPGWPERVRPPGSPGWEPTAVAWLLDQAPPEYRMMPVVTRHPLVLAWLTARHVEAATAATRGALSRVRWELGSVLEPPATAELLEALEGERVRLRATARAVELITAALSGGRYVPRL